MDPQDLPAILGEKKQSALSILMDTVDVPGRPASLSSQLGTIGEGQGNNDADELAALAAEVQSESSDDSSSDDDDEDEIAVIASPPAASSTTTAAAAATTAAAAAAAADGDTSSASASAASPAKPPVPASKLGIVTYIQKPSGERHQAVILGDGMTIRDPSATEKDQFDNVIEWMESKEGKKEEEGEVNYLTMGMNMNSWGDSDSDSSSSGSDSDEGAEFEVEATHVVSVSSVCSKDGEHLATVSGNNVVRADEETTWSDFLRKVSNLAHNVVRRKLTDVSVIRPGGLDTEDVVITCLEQLDAKDTVIVSVKAGDPVTMDDDSYSDGSSGDEIPLPGAGSSGSGSGSGSSDSGSGSGSDSSDGGNSDGDVLFDVDFSAFENDEPSGFDGFSMEQAAAAAKAAAPAPAPPPALPITDLEVEDDEFAAEEAEEGDDFIVDEDEWNNAGATTVAQKELPRTASDMDTLALMAKAVDANSPVRRKVKQKGQKLFAAGDLQLDAEDAGVGVGGRRARGGRSHSHTRSSSADFTGLDLGNLAFAEVASDHGSGEFSLHGGPSEAESPKPPSLDNNVLTPSANIAKGPTQNNTSSGSLGSNSSDSSAEVVDESWADFDV